MLSTDHGVRLQVLSLETYSVFIVDTDAEDRVVRDRILTVISPLRVTWFFFFFWCWFLREVTSLTNTKVVASV